MVVKSRLRVIGNHGKKFFTTEDRQRKQPRLLKRTATRIARRSGMDADRSAAFRLAGISFLQTSLHKKKTG